MYGKALRMAKHVAAPPRRCGSRSSGRPLARMAVNGDRRPVAGAARGRGLDVGAAPPGPEPVEHASASGQRGDASTSAASRSHEVADRHAALDLAAAGVHADGAVAHVVVADDEHVRDLLQLGGADALAELVGGLHHVDAEALGAEPVGDAARRRRRGRRPPAAPAPGPAPATPGRRRRSARRSTPKNRSIEPNRARWIMIGRWRALSAPDVLQVEALRRLKSNWIVDSCHVRPMASRTSMSIFGP